MLGRALHTLKLPSAIGGNNVETVYKRLDSTWLQTQQHSDIFAKQVQLYSQTLRRYVGHRLVPSLSSIH